MKNYIKEIKVAKARAAEPNDQEWQLIQKQMLKPDLFERKDVIVFEPYLANNFKDRDEERFPLPILKRFQKTLVGRSVLSDHDRRERDGKVFYVGIEKMGLGETVELVGESIYPDFMKHLRQIEKIDDGVYWLVPKYFMLNVTDKEKAAIRKIASGIDGYVSIGFSAPSMVPFKDESGTVLWWEYVNTKGRQVEATEMSRVFLGAQLGTGHKDSKVIKNKGVSKMDVILKSLGDYKLVITDADVNQDWVKALDEKIKSAIDKVKEENVEFMDEVDTLEKGLKAAEKQLKEVAEVFGVEKIDVQAIKDFVADAKAQKEIAKAYVKSLIDRSLQIERELSLIEADEVDAEKEMLEDMSLEKLQRWVSRHEKMYEEKFPGRSQIGEKPEENEPAGAVEEDNEKYNVV